MRIKYYKDKFGCIWKYDQGYKWHQWIKPGHILFSAGWKRYAITPLRFFRIKEISKKEAFIEIL